MAASRKGSRKKKGSAKRSIPVRAAPDASDLCLQCGMCCDGTLFAHITIGDDEHEYVESLGFELAHEDDGTVRGVLEPCPAFLDGCCSKYQSGRPATCGVYSCRLVREYEAGERSLDDALTVIELTRTLVREIEPGLGLPFGGFSRHRLRDFLAEYEPWTDPVANGQLLIALYRYNLLGVRYFFAPTKPVEEQAVAAGEQLANDAAGAATEVPAPD